MGARPHERRDGGGSQGHGTGAAALWLEGRDGHHLERPRHRVDLAALFWGHRMTAHRSPWTITALMSAATFTSMFALTTLMDSQSWLRTVLLVLLVVTAANAGVRAVTRSRFLPTAAALGAAIIVMVPLFAVDELGEKHLLSTPSAIGDLWQA